MSLFPVDIAVPGAEAMGIAIFWVFNEETRAVRLVRESGVLAVVVVVLIDDGPELDEFVVVVAGDVEFDPAAKVEVFVEVVELVAAAVPLVIVDVPLVVVALLMGEEEPVVGPVEFVEPVEFPVLLLLFVVDKVEFIAVAVVIVELRDDVEFRGVLDEFELLGEVEFEVDVVGLPAAAVEFEFGALEFEPVAVDVEFDDGEVEFVVLAVALLPTAVDVPLPADESAVPLAVVFVPGVVEFAAAAAAVEFVAVEFVVVVPLISAAGPPQNWPVKLMFWMMAKPPWKLFEML